MLGDIYAQLMHQVKHHRHIAALQHKLHIRVRLIESDEQCEAKVTHRQQRVY